MGLVSSRRPALGRCALRLAAVCILGLLFYGSSWLPLRTMTRDWASLVAKTAGWEVQDYVHDGSPAMRAGGRAFEFSPDCTYIDLFLLTAPLVFRRSATAGRNVARLAVLFAAIQAVNLARVAGAVVFYADGASWFLVHDLVDMLVYFPALIVAGLAGFAEDLASKPRGSPEESTRLDPAGSAC